MNKFLLTGTCVMHSPVITVYPVPCSSRMPVSCSCWGNLRRKVMRSQPQALLRDVTSTHHSPVPLSVLVYPRFQVRLLLVSVAHAVAWFRLSEGSAFLVTITVSGQFASLVQLPSKLTPKWIFGSPSYFSLASLCARNPNSLLTRANCP